MKFANEIERFQNKLKGWELDCERLENLKRNNESIISKIREENRQKENKYLEKIQELT